MIPFRAENPTHGTSYVTIALIAINCLVFLYEVTRPGDGMQKFIWKYGYVPAEFVHGSDAVRKELQTANNAPPTIYEDQRTRRRFLVPTPQLPVEEATFYPAWVNIFTCMFLHGGWMHLLGNLLYLWIFGNNIEDKLGPVLFVVFYLGTGVAGNLAHTWWVPSLVPLVGASGAISGVMGAYIVLFPRVRILAVIPWYFYWFTVRLPAWVFLGVYYLIQNLVPAFQPSQGSVAYWAHIGGFAAGAAMIFLFPHHKHPPRARPGPPRSDHEADFEF